MYICDICDISYSIWFVSSTLTKDNDLVFSKGSICALVGNSKCESCSNNVFWWTCLADFIIAKQNNDINALCDIMKNKIEKLFI